MAKAKSAWFDISYSEAIKINFQAIHTGSNITNTSESINVQEMLNVH